MALRLRSSLTYTLVTARFAESEGVMYAFSLHHSVRVPVLTSVFCLAAASTLVAADVCISVDESRDMFSPQDRTAAVMLLSRQFEIEGERVVAAGCPNTYVLSHVQLGSTITITLSGPKGQRDATARGLDDVPAVYSQMVRSLLRGVPMSAQGVTDRGNVSNTQGDIPNRRHADSLIYFRLGYGAFFADQTYGGPSVGFLGYRRELDSFAIDVSFFNINYKTAQRGSGYSYGYYGPSGNSSNSGTWMKLAFLRFTSPKSDRSPYFGGGLSWSTTSLQSENGYFDGNGLQGEVTGGYEFARSSTIRMFLQGDVGLPFYEVSGSSYQYANAPPYVTYLGSDSRWAPQLTVSLGVGWQRGGK